MLATVYRHGHEWRAACYFGPEPDEYDEHTSYVRRAAEAAALAHAKCF